MVCKVVFGRLEIDCWDFLTVEVLRSQTEITSMRKPDEKSEMVTEKNLKIGQSCESERGRRRCLICLKNRSFPALLTHLLSTANEWTVEEKLAALSHAKFNLVFRSLH